MRASESQPTAMLYLDPESAPVDWGHMLREADVEGQCANIAGWLKHRCRVQGIALSLQDKRLGRTFFYSETVPVFEPAVRY